MKYIAFLFLCGILFSGLAQTSSKSPSKKSTAKPKTPSRTSTKAVSTKNNTAILLEENVFDFGNANEGEYVSHRVWVTNTGNKSLVISDISAPCITADYSFSPILPGQKSYIDITFSTDGKIGTQYREITIRGNIENQDGALIFVKGVVYPR